MCQPVPTRTPYCSCAHSTILTIIKDKDRIFEHPSEQHQTNLNGAWKKLSPVVNDFDGIEETTEAVTKNFVALSQWFPICGPRTPGGPQRQYWGSVK
ncbi:hypothetical protein SK128_023700 [Halocaridina rubra]|uniref:Uncharacterized protein n=1 Tax=Halocaridina rubra TaxID=373956 RepID=A0AAN8ZSS9_HALRR